MSTLSAASRAAASALAVERTRIEAAVSNLANAESTRSADGKPYRRRDVVLRAEPVEGFQAALGRSTATGVKVAAVVEDQSEYRRRYEPSHPDADKDGFVSLPNVDAANEMVDMVGAARAYQANLAAIGIIRDMVAKALELGKG
ncbi:MAG TPA: flagellar basal body rod protein FlgC [Vicinamibacterales bacterium]|jgi:flagellar basal-body rod protein FlgC|nr:flagellar basal body rod protein FlgC [Vicinamibacterales bacterium]